MTNTCLLELPIPDDCVIVFDLDDTLVPERDFVISGFQTVARAIGDPSLWVRMLVWFDAGAKDVFGRVLAETKVRTSKSELLRIYREHKPDIKLDRATRNLLASLKSSGILLGLLTDGRSITQRNKIQALKLDKLLDEILISEEFGSEKPAERNFLHFESRFPKRSYVYVGDNLEKDFVSPNRLGWTTVCLLDDGRNIHRQNFLKATTSYLPRYQIKRLA